jgi:putative DNA-invertase from lambdoid prophage Rac
MNPKRAVIYVRVSTSNRTSNGDRFERNPEVQETPLRQMIAQRGWRLVHVYSDRTSGAKENRPDLNGLMEAARRGEFDVVAVSRSDRFARSIEQLILALAEFRSLSVDFVSCQEAFQSHCLRRAVAGTQFAPGERQQIERTYADTELRSA